MAVGVGASGTAAPASRVRICFSFVQELSKPRACPRSATCCHARVAPSGLEGLLARLAHALGVHVRAGVLGPRRRREDDARHRRQWTVVRGDDDPDLADGVRRHRRGAALCPAQRDHVGDAAGGDVVEERADRPGGGGELAYALRVRVLVLMNEDGRPRSAMAEACASK